MVMYHIGSWSEYVGYEYGDYGYEDAEEIFFHMFKGYIIRLLGP